MAIAWEFYRNYVLTAHDVLCKLGQKSGKIWIFFVVVGHDHVLSDFVNRMEFHGNLRNGEWRRMEFLTKKIEKYRCTRYITQWQPFNKSIERCSLSYAQRGHKQRERLPTHEICVGIRLFATSCLFFICNHTTTTKAAVVEATRTKCHRSYQKWYEVTVLLLATCEDPQSQRVRCSEKDTKKTRK